MTPKMIVSVQSEDDLNRAWGATLINVLQVDGVWMAAVWDNLHGAIVVVEATRLRQWEGVI